VPRKDDHPLRSNLNSTENELKSALEEVCDDTSVEKRTTDELIQMEETLSIANDAAKQAISLRKRIRSDEPLPPEPPIEPLPPVA
jgi:hypothetical protein